MLERVKNSRMMQNPTTKKVALGVMYSALATLAIVGVRAIVKRMANREGVDVDV